MLLVAGMVDECFVAFQTAGKKSIAWAWTQVDALTIVAFSLARGVMFIIPQVRDFALKL
jgi:hypothetical protein